MRLSDIKKMEMGPDRVIRGFTPKFRKLDADWDDYIEALVEMEDMGKFAKVEGEALYHSHGTPGFEWIQDQYFERRLFDAIEAYHTTSGEGFFNTMYSGTSAVCHRLADLGEGPRACRIWRSHVAAAKSHFWWYVGERTRGFKMIKNWMAPEAEQRASHDATVAKIPEKKRVMLRILGEFRDFAAYAKAQASDLERIAADIAAVEAEARPKPDGKPDPRKMDEGLFWNLIGDPALPLAERLETLADRLAGFKPAEIKAFDKILRTLDADLYRTDIWALAYLLQGGCSDDSFEQFRGWLILQGEDVVRGTEKNPDSFDTDLHTGGLAGGMDALRDAAPLAYEMRAGKPMTPNKMPLRTLTGPDWDEDDFAKYLPRVAAKTGAA